MLIDIRIPRLGWSMEEGKFVGWLKHEGELVKKGDLLYALEGDKSTSEVESFDEGILEFLEDGPADGDVVTVGRLIGRLHSAEKGGEDAPTTTKHIHASPRARKTAERLGVDWRGLEGSGKDGRIRERDVLAAAPRTESAPAPIASPNSDVRRLIAERMLAGHLQNAPVTLFATVDATRLVDLRAQFKEAGGPAPSFNDFVVKFTALALRDHPAFNSRWENGSVVPEASIHVGIAVDAPKGLLVPVIRDADRLSIREIASLSRSLAALARAGKATPAQLSGGTFTVTNLGGEGIDAFTPIINPPQCAILGIGRIVKRPVWADGAFVPRDVVTLCLTFDHRVADGAPAARFLAAVREGIERPSARLIS